MKRPRPIVPAGQDPTVLCCLEAENRLFWSYELGTSVKVRVALRSEIPVHAGA